MLFFFPKNQKTRSYEAKYLAKIKSYDLSTDLYQTKPKSQRKKHSAKFFLTEDYADLNNYISTFGACLFVLVFINDVHLKNSCYFVPCWHQTNCTTITWTIPVTIFQWLALFQWLGFIPTFHDF